MLKERSSFSREWMPMHIAVQYIGYRHVGNGLHPSWTFPASAIVCHLPVALAESFVLGTISYFMAGMSARLVGRGACLMRACCTFILDR